MAIIDDILGEEKPEVKNEQLAEISAMAQEQLDIMGRNKNGDYITSAPSATAVGELKKWAKAQNTFCEGLILQYSISELAAALVFRLDGLARLSHQALPDAMSALEMTEFKLANGFKVKVVDEVSAAILKEKEEQAAAFLESIGCGDVVKDNVTISLGKGEREKASDFLSLARSLGVEASEKLSVHPMTLKSLVKEQLAQGVEFPVESFSVFPYKKTDIKPAKK